MTECPSVLPCCPLRGIYLLGGFAASGFCEKSRGEVRSTDQNKMLRSNYQTKRIGRFPLLYLPPQTRYIDCSEEHK